jgi:hypothetical protein
MHPGGIGLAELVEGQMHGFQCTFQALEGADGRQDMGGIGAPGAPDLKPAAGFAGDQERIQ